jgi:hypothetical protein
MVNTDPGDQQETLAAFSHSNATERADENAPTDNATEDDPSRSPLDCPVCGIRWPDKPAAEQCHPLPRLKREHDAAVTSPDDPHTAFAVPAHLSAELSDLIHRVQGRLRDTSDANPLRVAANDIAQNVLSITEMNEAWHVFLHLVFLQQLQIIPNYPLSVTADTDQPRIHTFCNNSNEINGHITNPDPANSPVLTRDRIYRRKVLTTTSEFIPAILRYKWATEIQFTEDWPAIRTNAVFNEQTAHNVLVRKVRNWITHHPYVKWATAPHEITAGAVKFEAETLIQPLTLRPDGDAPPHPTYMFDFAGFQSDSPPKLAVLGIVLTDRDIHRHAMELIMMAKTRATGVIVVQSRDELIRFIKAIFGLFADEPDAADVENRYNSRPNIPAINEQLSEDSKLFKHTKFVSVKQLVDEIVKPTDILGPALIQTEAEQ